MLKVKNEVLHKNLRMSNPALTFYVIPILALCADKKLVRDQMNYEILYQNFWLPDEL